MSRTPSVLAGLALSLALGPGCTAPPLRPVEADQAVAADPSAAEAIVGGVVVRARPGDWAGRPARLPVHATVLEVAVLNGSPAWIRVYPEQFDLITSTGMRYRARELGPVSTTFAAAGPPVGTPPARVLQSTLRPGERESFFVAFDVPSATLAGATRVAQGDTEDRGALGEARLAFGRAPR